MASTVFQDYNQNNPIVSSWLNDINNGVYSPGGVPKVSSLIPVAWVRFSVTAGIVTIQQSFNISSVTRSSAGTFLVTYSEILTNVANCYEIAQNQAGFISYGAETTQSVVVNTGNTTNVPTDPGTCSVVIYGAN